MRERESNSDNANWVWSCLRYVLSIHFFLFELISPIKKTTERCVSIKHKKGKNRHQNNPLPRKKQRKKNSYPHSLSFINPIQKFSINLKERKDARALKIPFQERNCYHKVGLSLGKGTMPMGTPTTSYTILIAKSIKNKTCKYKC